MTTFFRVERPYNECGQATEPDTVYLSVVASVLSKRTFTKTDKNTRQCKACTEQKGKPGIKTSQ